MQKLIAYDWGGRTLWRVDGRGIGVAFGYDDASRSTTISQIHPPPTAPSSSSPPRSPPATATGRPSPSPLGKRD
jgi:hypothetical protein